MGSRLLRSISRGHSYSQRSFLHLSSPATLHTLPKSAFASLPGPAIWEPKPLFTPPANIRFLTATPDSDFSKLLSNAQDIKCRFPVSLSTPIWAPIRAFCSDTAVLPPVSDPDVKRALKNVLASNWDDLEESLRSTVMNALSRVTDDKSGKEALANAWRAAEAVEHFSGVLESFRMELDEMSGSTGENVRPLPAEIQGALQAAYKRYSNYLNAFGPEETYLRKKVENELGTSMIHIKMRCAGLDSEWGKVTLLGTSGISGSYIEQRSNQICP